MDFKISVVGLGKLGACSAASFSAKGFDVIGVDINKNFVDAINSGKAPVVESRLQELITASSGRLTATGDFNKAITDSDVTFLIVPTPSKEDGNFSTDYLKSALTELAKAFKNVKKYHVFVVTSTVSPGATEKELIPLVESVSGKKLNVDFGFAYNPEFIALGSVITNFLNPDMVLIGESEKKVGDMLEAIYQKVCENKPYIARMSIISAEITKLSLNSYITMKISFANTLANLCEKIPGANLDHITGALGADKRISPYYLKGGLSYGGPCFPRDNRAFAAFAKKYNVDPLLAKTTDTVNQMQTSHTVERILSALKTNDGVVAILGLSYKPNTPVIEESPAIGIIEELLKQKANVVVYDPFAMDNAKNQLKDSVRYASSVSECLANASVCIITTQAIEFKALQSKDFGSKLETVIDCWRVVDSEQLPNNVTYIGVGISKAK